MLVPVEEIDHYTFCGQLNALERRHARDLLESLPIAATDRIVCDGATLSKPLRSRFRQLEAVDHGESVHVAVAAASIVAKVATARGL